MSYVNVEGSGPGASIVSAVLKTVGLQTSSIQTSSVGDARLVTLNGPTLFLIKDLFGRAVFKKLLQLSTDLKHRVLAWEVGAEPVIVNDHALLVPLNDLTELFHGKEMVGSNKPPELTVEAHGRSANEGEPAGARWAFVWFLQDLVLPDQTSCYLQAVDGGWMFLAPSLKGTLVQVTTPDSDIESGRNIALKAIAQALPSSSASCFSLDSTPHQFDASPRFNNIQNKDAVMIGDQMMALDPISGDGIGHILRSAILLASLVKGGYHNTAGGIDIYYARLRHTYISHLATCEKYYQQINASNMWNRVIEDMQNQRSFLQREELMCNSTSYVLNRSEISVQV